MDLDEYVTFLSRLFEKLAYQDGDGLWFWRQERDVAHGELATMDVEASASPSGRQLSIQLSRRETQLAHSTSLVSPGSAQVHKRRSSSGHQRSPALMPPPVVREPTYREMVARPGDKAGARLSRAPKTLAALMAVARNEERCGRPPVPVHCSGRGTGGEEKKGEHSGRGRGRDGHDTTGGGSDLAASTPQDLDRPRSPTATSSSAAHPPRPMSGGGLVAPPSSPLAGNRRGCGTPQTQWRARTSEKDAAVAALAASALGPDAAGIPKQQHPEEEQRSLPRAHSLPHLPPGPHSTPPAAPGSMDGLRPPPRKTSRPSTPAGRRAAQRRFHTERRSPVSGVLSTIELMGTEGSSGGSVGVRTAVQYRSKAFASNALRSLPAAAMASLAPPPWVCNTVATKSEPRPGDIQTNGLFTAQKIARSPPPPRHPQAACAGESRPPLAEPAAQALRSTPPRVYEPMPGRSPHPRVPEARSAGTLRLSAYMLTFPEP